MTTSNPTPILDVSKIRADFPVLHQEVNGKPLVYMDTGATSQKPQCVIDALVQFYTADNSNVHRGVHTLSQRATEDYDTARSKARQFLNAASDQEIVFVKGTTDAMSLTRAGVDHWTHQMVGIARKCGAHFDGWGAALPS